MRMEEFQIRCHPEQALADGDIVACRAPDVSLFHGHESALAKQIDPRQIGKVATETAAVTIVIKNQVCTHAGVESCGVATTG
jgi:hypothetical protein